MHVLAPSRHHTKSFVRAQCPPDRYPKSAMEQIDDLFVFLQEVSRLRRFEKIRVDRSPARKTYGGSPKGIQQGDRIPMSLHF